MKIEIRSAAPSDLAALQPLIAGYYASSPVPFTPDVAAVEKHMQTLITPGNHLGGLLVATADGQLAGFAFLYFHFNKRALQLVVHLNDLYVDARFRRHGIARQLLNAVFAWAKTQGALEVTWETRTSNTGAQALYDQLGERETGWIHFAHAID